MYNCPFCAAAGGSHGVGCPVERGEKSYIYSSTAFTPQDYHANRSEQPVVSGYPDINPLNQAAPPYYYSGRDIPTRDVPEASASNNVIYSPPLDLPLTAWTPDIQTHPPYGMQVTDATYNGTRVDYSAYQHVPFPPALYIDLANSNHQGDSLFGFLPPLLNPSADQHYTQDQLPSVTPEHNHFSPQPTLMVAHRPSARRHTGALASDPVGGAGSKATEMPAGSSLVNDVGFQTSRKRKPAVALDEARQVKRTRRPAQMVLPVILSIPPHLRIVEQFLYQCDVEQKGWTPSETIDFRVKGVGGMKFTDAMNLRFDGPDDRHEPVFEDDGVGTSVSCRIHFVRYPAYSKPRQIMTTNHKKEKAPITKEKLAYEVAKCIKAYLVKLEKGKTPFHIPFGDMYLTRLVNVSRASWQPEICRQANPWTRS